MNLRRFLAMRSLPTEATCVTIGADHYKLDKGNIMSVSIAATGEEPETIYIREADAARVEKYTGVSPERYHDQAVGLERAMEIVRDLFKPGLMVTYSVQNYTRPWAMHTMPMIFRPKDCLWFDVLSYIQYGDQGRPFPTQAQDMDDVCTVVNSVRGMPFKDAVVSRLPHPDPFDASDELPELERKIYQVQQFWEYCLDREL